MEQHEPSIPVPPPPSLGAAAPVFEAPVQSLWILALSAIASLFFLFCGGLGMALSMGSGKSGTNPIQHIMPVFTCFTIWGLGWAVVQLLRPHRAALTDTHLILISRIGRQRIAWSDIHKAEVKSEFGGLFGGLGSGMAPKSPANGSVFQLFDRFGKAIAELPVNFTAFGTLHAEIDRRSREARGPGAAPLAPPKKKQGRRTMILGGVFLVAMGIGSFAMGFETWSEQRALQTDGVPASAEIVRLYQFNGHPRIEYRVKLADGREATSNVLIEQEAWDALKGQKNVPVEHARNDPANNRLLFGQKQETDWTAIILMPGGVAELLLGLAMLGLAMAGYSDIRFTAGKLRLVRDNDPEPQPFPVATAEASADPAAAPSGSVVADPLAGEPEVPVGIRIFGFLGILNGAFGLAICTILLLVALGDTFQFSNLHDPTNPTSPRLQFWNLASALAGVLLNLVFAGACIGLFYLKNWARRAGLTVSVLKIVLCIAAIIVSFATIPMGETTDPFEAAERRRAITHHSVGCFGSMGAMLFPALMIWVLNSRMAKGLFREEGQ